MLEGGYGHRPTVRHFVVSFGRLEGGPAVAPKLLHPSKWELVDAIAAAARSAIAALFREHPGEHFYYCALVTSGEAIAPSLTAWSKEALDAAVSQCGDDPSARAELKWSYADSPYYCYGDENFSEVRRLFDAFSVPDASDEDAWRASYTLRMSAMEDALARLDQSGLFGTGSRRAGIVINVESMPPDHTNVERALRMNPRAALEDWLREAAEPTSMVGK
jgi:hypothetical protein